jgi:hypothetical protein
MNLISKKSYSFGIIFIFLTYALEQKATIDTDSVQVISAAAVHGLISYNLYGKFEIVGKSEDENCAHFIKDVIGDIVVKPGLSSKVSLPFYQILKIRSGLQDGQFKFWSKFFGKGIKNVFDISKLWNKFGALSDNIKNKAALALAINASLRFGSGKLTEYGVDKIKNISKDYSNSLEILGKISASAAHIWLIDPAINLASLVGACYLTEDAYEQNELIDFLQQEGKKLSDTYGIIFDTQAYLRGLTK